MTIKQYLKYAAEGGYEAEDINLELIANKPMLYQFELCTVLLDPESWKAVGLCADNRAHQNAIDQGVFISSERWPWELKFMEMPGALIDGKTLEEYIATL